MAKNIITQLRSSYSFLSPVEKRIADVLLKDPEKFIRMTSMQLAETADVAQGSIHNFAKKFSGGGFSALKLMVASCINKTVEPPVFTAIDANRTLKEVMAQKIKGNIAAFYNTLEINDEQELQTAVELLLKTNRILTYGVYYSGVSAEDFCYHLIQFGIPATYVADALMSAVSASMLDQNGLIFAVSSSGRTKEIIDVVQIARGKGATVICLTSDRFSPLAALSDVVLLSAPSGMSVAESGDEVRLTQQLVLDTLCSLIRVKIDNGDKTRFFKLKEIVNSHSIQD
jgi:DNA-binding MurR/RpiR family transcriptional regulator